MATHMCSETRATPQSPLRGPLFSWIGVKVCSPIARTSKSTYDSCDCIGLQEFHPVKTINHNN